MTGWNLPPGCNVSDLPGNSPEDERVEALMDKIYDCLSAVEAMDEIREKVAQELFKLCEDSYQEGYFQGAADERMAMLEEQP